MVVMRRLLHGFRRTEAVHQHDMRAARGGGVERPGVGIECAHIVDDSGPRLRRRRHHGGFRRVDRERRATIFQPFDHRHNAAQFLGLGHRIGAGPRRFAADVENVGPGGGERLAMLDGRLRRRMLAAIGKAVGRDIDNAHDERALLSKPGKGRALGREPIERLADGIQSMAALPGRPAAQIGDGNVQTPRVSGMGRFAHQQFDALDRGGTSG